MEPQPLDPALAELAMRDQVAAAAAATCRRAAALIDQGAVLLPVEAPRLTRLMLSAQPGGGRRGLCTTLMQGGPDTCYTFTERMLVCHGCMTELMSMADARGVRMCSGCGAYAHVGADAEHVVRLCIAQHGHVIAVTYLCPVCLTVEQADTPTL